MNKLMTPWVLLISLFWADLSYACPFCDAGGAETALFVILIFGTFAISAFFVFLAFKKKGYFDEDLKLESVVLEAENIHSTKGK